MPRQLRGRYDAKLFVEFLDAHVVEVQPDRGFPAKTINGRLLEGGGVRQSMHNWRSGKVPYLGLQVVDRVLLRFGFVLSEFEAWAIEHYGWDGYLPGSEKYEGGAANAHALLCS